MNLVNGKPNSSIKIFDRGFLYGDAVFETILVENKIPQNLTQHLQRLKKGIYQLKIKNFDIELLRKYIKTGKRKTIPFAKQTVVTVEMYEFKFI